MQENGDKTGGRAGETAAVVGTNPE
jgi:hypothetical protein